MDRRQRMTLLGIAAVIAVAAVVIALVAGGGDDDKDKTDSTTAAQTETTTTTTDGDTSTTTTTEAAPPEPQVTTANIQIVGGKPDGGVQKIEVKKNEPLEIQVGSDEELPIHFHGYDIEKDAGPGKPAIFKLKKANIDGVFEMEIESTKTKIAEITVNP
jgi:hypothetical protein